VKGKECIEVRKDHTRRERDKFDSGVGNRRGN